MSNIQEFIQELQSIISSDSTANSYHRALKYLNDNKYQTVRDIPEEARRDFLKTIKGARNG